MALTVTLVSGPRRSGKSLLASLLIGEVLDRAPHYVRLSAVNGGKRPPLGIRPPRDECSVAGAHWLCYETDRVFEVLQGGLAAIHHRDGDAWVVIEADADPVLRHAYPYDQQVFVMPVPQSLEHVFRSSNQAARALQDMMDDTAEFAAEVFGVARGDGCLDDDSWAGHDLLTKSEIRLFLASPLGDQLATRIQLHPEYHGLIESDVVLINTAVSGMHEGRDTPLACRRLEQLLSRVEAPSARRDTIFFCDPSDQRDPRRHDLLSSLRTLCLQGP